MFKGELVAYNSSAKYLGVTIDKTVDQLKTRNNILHKISGSGWGADVHLSTGFCLSHGQSIGVTCDLITETLLLLTPNSINQ